MPRLVEVGRRRRVMAVAVDDHVLEPLLAEEAPAWTCPVAAVKTTAAGEPASLAGGARLKPRPCGHARSRDGGRAPASAVARIRSGPDIALHAQPALSRQI